MIDQNEGCFCRGPLWNSNGVIQVRLRCVVRRGLSRLSTRFTDLSSSVGSHQNCGSSCQASYVTGSKPRRRTVANHQAQVFP